jgi:hypothetical protein
MLFTELIIRTLVEVFGVRQPGILTARVGRFPQEGGVTRAW